MNRSVWSLGFGLALALGCRMKPCDEGELAAIADGSSDRSLAARRVRSSAIAEACPQMPRELASSLGLINHEWEPGSAEARAEVREYAALRSATCPVAGDEWRRALVAEDRDAAVFEVCGLERYGLLDADEAFLFDDLDGFMLYEWLSSRRIDPALARRVVRGQMVVGSTPDELMELCREWWVACPEAYEQAGVKLPVSLWTRERMHSSVTELMVTADDEVIGGPGEWGALQVAADAGASWGVVVDALFHAGETEQGLAWIKFIVLTDHERRAMLVEPGRLWASDRYRDVAPWQLEIGMRGDAIELRQGSKREVVATIGDCTSPEPICFDPASLRAVLERFERDIPSNERAEIRPARDVAYQQVVWLLEVARGERCVMSTLEPQREGCLFRDLVVDADPPLHRNMHAKIGFGQATAKALEPKRRLLRARGRPSPEAALALFETKRDELLACVLADHELLARTPARSELKIYWGPVSLPDGWSVGVVPSDGRERPELSSCIARELATELVAARRLEFLVANAELELSIPIVLEPALGD